MNYGGKGVYVCEHWHNFQNFAEWFYERDNPFNYDIQLDKDLFSFGMETSFYSPDTCCLLSSQINQSLSKLFCKYVYKRQNLDIWFCMDNETRTISSKHKDVIETCVLLEKIKDSFSILRKIERGTYSNEIILQMLLIIDTFFVELNTKYFDTSKNIKSLYSC